MDAQYDKTFFQQHQDGARTSAEVVLARLRSLCEPKVVASAVDVGCGLGSWLRVLTANGVPDIIGIDGDYVDRQLLEIPESCFLPRDLRTPFDLERRFDLALSVEVAEHLPRESAPEFVRTLTSLAPVVLFSAAIPGQGGEHHVNEQWPGYWAGHFARNDFVAIDCLRWSLWGDQRVEFWYQQNVLVYAAKSSLAEYPRLAEEYRRTEGRVASLVHPEVLERWKQWGLSQCDAYWALAAPERASK